MWKLSNLTKLFDDYIVYISKTSLYNSLIRNKGIIILTSDSNKWISKYFVLSINQIKITLILMDGKTWE